MTERESEQVEDRECPNGKVIKLYKLPIYKVWDEMKRRCNSERATNYKRYGGRGIKVCDEWGNPNTFIEWANLNGYKKGLSLDRMDNNGNYEPENCRFATPTEQARNTRRNVRITINGKSKTLMEWSEESGLTYWALKRRYRNGDRGEFLLRDRWSVYEYKK